MQNPLIPRIVKIHQESLLAQACNDRSASLAVRRQRLSFFVRLGDLLIFAGLKLRERYEPTVSSDLKSLQTGCFGR